MNERQLPLDRIREFMRQHAKLGSWERERIARVAHDLHRPPAELRMGDLQFLLDSLDQIRDLAYRGALGGMDSETRSRIFMIASGMAPGMALPATGSEQSADARPEMPLRPVADVGDPFAGGGGQRRTRTCVHCGRRCGDAAGGGRGGQWGPGLPPERAWTPGLLHPGDPRRPPAAQLRRLLEGPAVHPDGVAAGPSAPSVGRPDLDRRQLEAATAQARGAVR